MSIKDDRSKDIIHKAAAQFFQEESSGTALITVTRVDLSDDARQATILLSVLPEEFEEQVLAFAERKRGELRTHIKRTTKLPRLPYISVGIDIGEKNRQRIEELGNMSE